MLRISNTIPTSAAARQGSLWTYPSAKVAQRVNKLLACQASEWECRHITHLGAGIAVFPRGRYSLFLDLMLTEIMTINNAAHDAHFIEQFITAILERRTSYAGTRDHPKWNDRHMRRAAPPHPVFRCIADDSTATFTIVWHGESRPDTAPVSGTGGHG
ncbi:hypothetical protein SCLCIDRAFT_840818 [Scleroderma citrinum Foug A]|uniref:Uncharacterized protein n=1 Tax=Scleroderma citrinum Foug A TaxID=1036808 RepID=A0A0C2ZKZ3_9AGAM|nr:hypothetical protein SCLCIDRAFT_840818 [Scleroderma citrinum Foug A]